MVYTYCLLPYLTNKIDNLQNSFNSNLSKPSMSSFILYSFAILFIVGHTNAQWCEDYFTCSSSTCSGTTGLWYKCADGRCKQNIQECLLHCKDDGVYYVCDNGHYVCHFNQCKPVYMFTSFFKKKNKTK